MRRTARTGITIIVSVAGQLPKRDESQRELGVVTHKVLRPEKEAVTATQYYNPPTADQKL